MELGRGASQDPGLRINEVLTRTHHQPPGRDSRGFALSGYNAHIRDARVARPSCFLGRHRFDSGGVVWAARMLP